MSARHPAQRAFEERTCAAFGRRRDPVMGRYADFRHSARPTPLAWRHCRCQGQDLLLRQWQHHSVHSVPARRLPSLRRQHAACRRVSRLLIRHASAQVLMNILKTLRLYRRVPLRRLTTMTSREIGGEFQTTT